MLAIEYVPYAGPIVTRAEAKAAGLTRYFNANPCPKGHIAERVTANGTCRVCSNRMSNAVHKAAPKKRAAHAKARRDANLERFHVTEGQYRERSRDRINLRNNKRYEAGPGKKYARAYHVKNAAKIQRRVLVWGKKNPEKKRAISHNYRARKASAEGSHTAADILTLFEKQQQKCAYCRTSIKPGYHVDHIVALAKGGSNRASNLQLTCKRCNSSKGATDPITFAQRMGLLI